MTSEQALEMIDGYGIWQDGGPEILSDYDVKNNLNKDCPSVEMTGYVLKVSVRVKTEIKIYIYQVTSEAWNNSSAGGKELHKVLARASARLGLLTALTSRTCPI